MNKVSSISILAILMMQAVTTVASEDIASVTSTPSATLFAKVAALDSAVFDAFNQCSSTEQLQKYAEYFVPDIEFYHDTGGVTWNRQDMLASTSKNVCGKYRRELISDSLKVFPIKDFGAIAQGAHRFCQFSTGQCEGLADFTMVWRKQENEWQITRVLSYGHRPNTAAKK